MSQAERKLQQIANVRQGFIHKFPFNLGSSADQPESKKFCIFKFKERDSKKFQLKGFIALPMPEVNEGLNVKYAQSELGVVGAGLVGGVGANDMSNLNGITDALLSGIRSYNTETFSRVLSDMALKSSPGLRNSITKGLGTVQNNYLTNAFDSIGFREFSFSFKLNPTRSEESESIRDIISQFKRSMMPESILKENPENKEIPGPDTGIQKIPDRLDVDFFPTTNNYGTIDTLNNMVKIRNAVITNFEVEYSEGTINPTFFEADQQGNHAPFTVNFTVALKETTVYTKERCEEDYRGTN